MLLESDKAIIQIILNGELLLGRELTKKSIQDWVNICIKEYSNLN